MCVAVPTKVLHTLRHWRMMWHVCTVLVCMRRAQSTGRVILQACVHSNAQPLLLLLAADALAIAEGKGNAAAFSEAVAQANLGQVISAPDLVRLAKVLPVRWRF